MRDEFRRLARVSMKHKARYQTGHNKSHQLSAYPESSYTSPLLLSASTTAFRCRQGRQYNDDGPQGPTRRRVVTHRDALPGRALTAVEGIYYVRTGLPFRVVVEAVTHEGGGGRGD